MPLVHAYRRKKPHTVDLHGRRFDFVADAEGAHVCEVPEGPSLDRLLEIDDAFRLHGVQPVALPPALKLEDDDDDGAPPSPFVLTVEGDDDEEKTIDLRTIDRAALNAFCVDNDIPVPHPNAKDDTVRQKIVDFLAGA